MSAHFMMGFFTSALLLLFGLQGSIGRPAIINQRPIIGILAEEYFENKNSQAPNGSHIVASYVKMVESSGARVVPIFIGKDLAYYKNIVNTVNGILLPGGGVDLWAEDGYGKAADIIYNLVLNANRNGTYFPLFGVCLGLEVLGVVSAEMSRTVLVDCKGVENIALPLNFSDDYRSSALFSGTPQHIIDSLKTNITSNHHSKCLTQASLYENNLTETWKVTSTSGVRGDLKFVSSMEHVEFPHIFGIQFHPEKVPFEWYNKNNDPHDFNAIVANRWFYDYFVDLARRNDNSFSNKQKEESSIIYNYPAIYTGGYFQQIYRFQYSDSASTNLISVVSQQ